MGGERDNKTISINGHEVLPGTTKLVSIEIARLPTGTLIDIPVHVFNSKKEGPTVLVQAGLHGDEINGIETLRRMLQLGEFTTNRGAVIVVPILNVFGFIHFSRDVPDGKDVNRSFPGSRLGSLASRMAYHFTNEILPQIDFGIDLHTGGAQRSNYPQVRYTEGDETSEKMALQFNAPFYFSSRLITGSFRKAAHKLGKPIIVYEAGESMRFDEMAITTAIQGIRNVFAGLDMSKEEDKSNTKSSIHLQNTKWVRASRAGMFIPEVKNGALIQKGQVLGKVTDIFAKKSKEIKSPMEGYVICLNHQAVVNQGDALFHVGK
ncbi:MAG: succinylglutamate desuccinylase/aspartoacylase family protein [Croceitalea sp.]|nr:succinylglutamate desuccinylase/aspartoacylase family protein [Croceitalea sp.]MBT8238723.1 succinylglutamate desuccinylase/aspartoacylase family protein [Croceitalea sp.]NNC33970.1 succinylglutamate desuccinylase/aspartoacylase family protein [Croceitalea sp.]NNL09594.1 succinylglutamate desuccinylase/aspartoacylase family protein [Croceitalea sp.]NNM18413.1 succinylglutamate desuccinylase/aspartoacylase family protein [Croceitalea sp.]